MVSTLTWHNANIHELGECGRRFANGTADIPQTQTHMHARVRRLHSAQISAGLETYPKVHHICMCTEMANRRESTKPKYKHEVRMCRAKKNNEKNGNRNMNRHRQVLCEMCNDLINNYGHNVWNERLGSWPLSISL